MRRETRHLAACGDRLGVLTSGAGGAVAALPGWCTGPGHLQRLDNTSQNALRLVLGRGDDWRQRDASRLHCAASIAMGRAAKPRGQTKHYTLGLNRPHPPGGRLVDMQSLEEVCECQLSLLQAQFFQLPGLKLQQRGGRGGGLFNAAAASVKYPEIAW